MPATNKHCCCLPSTDDLLQLPLVCSLSALTSPAIGYGEKILVEAASFYNSTRESSTFEQLGFLVRKDRLPQARYRFGEWNGVS